MKGKIKEKIKTNKLEVATWVAALIPLLLYIATLNRLPERIPVEFDAAGNAVRYASKHSASMLLQMSMGLWAMIAFGMSFKFVLNLNYREENPRTERVKKIFAVSLLMVTVVFSSFSILILLKLL